ncbi:MAG TPA: lactate racemase domain-containing protein [Clostridia bacterium]|nr:lactate racemase domain-containing protein [Clostridia bacterium]
MKEIILKSTSNSGISDNELRRALAESLGERKSELKKILLIPPDFTRMHSGAGKITAMFYNILKDSCSIDVMPALGTHEPMTSDEIREFFLGIVPKEAVIVHNWRTDVVKLGQVPAEFVSEVSEGLMTDPIDVEVNRHILDRTYDLIISMGQVVPHEVAGMANYSKNIFVGCGGSNMINQSHMLGAFYGLERIMGRDHSPVRKVFDYAEEHYIKDLPLLYVLTVTTLDEEGVVLHGLFTGRNRGLFEDAVKLSQEKNISFLDKPIKKAVVYLDEKEFKSTWLGNKAVYRTRMAIADGGELLVIAPGVSKFGEDDRNDELIRKYGYVGRKKVLELCRQNDDLKGNLSAAAHLIHGSSDGRFTITYASGKLTRSEIESVNFRYAKLDEALKRYDPGLLKDGWQTMDDGEEIFYISNPALGLWACRDRF